MNLLNTKVVMSALGIVAMLASPALAQKRQHVTHASQSDISRTYLYGPAVCCKPDVSDGGIGLAHLYPAHE